MARREVTESLDWHRIRDLPVREITDAQAEHDNLALTPLLTTPLGRREGAQLVNLQGFALRELAEQVELPDNRGVYLGLPVGEGKTLLFFLAPYVCEATRPMMVVPSGLRGKTWDEFQKYGRHWVQSPTPIKTFGFNEFYDDDALDIFEQFQPDLVMIDEGDKSSNQTGSFAKRADRWRVKTGCRFIVGTGTGTRFSMQDFSHMLIWTLAEGAPWPLDYETGEMWAAALDEKAKQNGKFPSKGPRIKPGALLRLADDFERKPMQTERDIARAAFQRRLNTTPGVILSNRDSCDQPFAIELRNAPEDSKINDAFDFFRDEEKTPGGWTLVETLEFYAHEMQLGCGMWYDMVPRPEPEYVHARRELAKFNRAHISRTAHYSVPECTKCGTVAKRPSGICSVCGGKVSKAIPYDTPEAVKKAFREHPVIEEWYDVQKPSYKGESRPRWVSGSVVHAAAKWAREHAGLVWTAFEPVGAAIAKAAGVKYYGPGGLASDGTSIERAKGGVAAVLSIAANLRGRNLQDRFCENYVVGMPQSARDLEQLFGRTHRQGQRRPVSAVLVMTSGLSRYAFDMALREASFVDASQGQTQKILRATITQSVFPPSRALRWREKEAA